MTSDQGELPGVEERPRCPRHDRSTDLGRMAQRLAELTGWPLFPQIPRGKRPCIRDNLRLATTDRLTLADWWDRWPDANLGLPCGPASALVLDVDPRHGGTLEALGELPHTPLVRTGGGGWHVYYAYPRLGEGQRLRATVAVAPGASAASPGLDVRGLGACVTLPPSVHASGERYRWLVSPCAAPLAACPAGLLARIVYVPPPPRPPRERSSNETTEQRIAAAIRYLSAVPGAPEGGGEHGGRDRTTYAAACKLLQHFADLSEGVLLDLLCAWDETANTPPLGEAVVRQKLQSARRGLATRG